MSTRKHAVYNFSDPQSLNRYAYTKNDPVNGRDPGGLSGQGFIFGVGASRQQPKDGPYSQMYGYDKQGNMTHGWGGDGRKNTGQNSNKYYIYAEWKEPVGRIWLRCGGEFEEQSSSELLSQIYNFYVY